MNNLVSVLVAAYRAEDFIDRSILSLLRQSYQNWEIIVASDDQVDYQRILHDKNIKDSRLRFTSTGKICSGPSTARNAALTAANGKIIATLDADDAYTSDRLERMVPLVSAHGAATSGLRLFRDDTMQEFPSLSRRYPAGLLTPENFIRAHMHASSLLVWDRQRVDVTWDEKIGFSEDLIHALRMYNFLDGIFFDPCESYLYFKRKQSITSSIDTSNTNPALTMITAFENLVFRTEQGSIGVENPGARDAMLRFWRAMIQIEKNFFSVSNDDPVMGFYNFFSQNREMFFSW